MARADPSTLSPKPSVLILIITVRITVLLSYLLGLQF